MKLSSCSLLLAGVALLPACTSLRTVNVTADSAMSVASVRVDVAPATSSLINVPVSEYWREGSAARAGAAGVQSLRFGPGHPAAQSVAVNTGGAKQVVVIADLPGQHTDAPGEGDTRRKLLSVKGKGVKAEARVLVTGGGLSVQ